MSDKFQVQFTDSISGTAYPSKGSTGLAESIESIQADGLITAPSWAFALGKSNFGQGAKIHDRWFDTNSMLLNMTAGKDYGTIKKGERVHALLVGASPFPKGSSYISDSVTEGRLKNNSFPLEPEHKDMLLGESAVYTFKDGIFQKVQVEPFTLNSYMEAQTEADHLTKRPFYMVLLTDDDIAQNKRQGVIIDNAYNSKSDIVLAGTRALWNGQLDTQKERGYRNQNIGLIGISDDSGRVGYAGSYSDGFYFSDTNVNGCSVGVAPEALNALAKETMVFESSNKLLEQLVQNGAQEIRGMNSSQIVGVDIENCLRTYLTEYADKK
jgi:hypothetical protein